MITKTIKDGILAVLGARKLVALLWVYNILFGVLLTLPFFRLLSKAIESNDVRLQMTQHLDLSWFIQTIDGTFTLNDVYIPLLIGFGFLFIIAKIFLDGGIIALFYFTEKEFTLSSFFSECSRFFVRMVQLFLAAISLFGLIFWGGISLINFVFADLIETASTYRAETFFSLTRILLIIGLFLMLRAMYDYAKITIIVNRGKAVINDLVSGIVFVIANLRYTTTLYYVLLLVSAGFSLFYSIVEEGIDSSNMISFIVLIVLQQLYILFKVWLRLVFMSSEFQIYSKLRLHHHGSQGSLF